MRVKIQFYLINVLKLLLKQLIKLKPKSKILIIAGSDSSGGAGIQADIKTVTTIGSYAMTAITAITVQNTQGVKSIIPIDPNEIKKSIKIAEKLMKGQGRILVRKSGTETKIRVMGESNNKKLLNHCINIISKKIK